MGHDGIFGFQGVDETGWCFPAGAFPFWFPKKMQLSEACGTTASARPLWKLVIQWRASQLHFPPGLWGRGKPIRWWAPFFGVKYSIVLVWWSWFMIGRESYILDGKKKAHFWVATGGALSEMPKNSSTGELDPFRRCKDHGERRQGGQSAWWSIGRSYQCFHFFGGGRFQKCWTCKSSKVGNFCAGTNGFRHQAAFLLGREATILWPWTTRSWLEISRCLWVLDLRSGSCSRW